MITDYHRALNWSVDVFFQRRWPALDRDDTIAAYTSDHGQSLFEGGYDLSHCSLTPTLHRGGVFAPLLVVTGQPELAAVFREEARRAHDRASHFEVFPPLLELMGYSRGWVESTYGPTLKAVPLMRKRGFVMGTFYEPGALWLNAE